LALVITKARGQLDVAIPYQQVAQQFMEQKIMQRRVGQHQADADNPGATPGNSASQVAQICALTQWGAR
jgi:hypothetical protein